jgi:molybdopterin synthase sulfur carrier subunit
MSIRVRYFARIRDLLGAAEEIFEPGPAMADAGALLALLSERAPAVASVLSHPSVRVEVNGVIGGRDATIADGDEVAVLPPFSGG